MVIFYDIYDKHRCNLGLVSVAEEDYCEVVISVLLFEIHISIIIS